MESRIEGLRKNPARRSFGTTAPGSFTHFYGVMTGREIGIPLEPVPYRGAAPLGEAWAKELQAVLRSPEVAKKLVELGLDVETSTPAEFTQRMTADLARWKTIIDSIGYKPGN